MGWARMKRQQQQRDWEEAIHERSPAKMLTGEQQRQSRRDSVSLGRKRGADAAEERAKLEERTTPTTTTTPNTTTSSREGRRGSNSLGRNAFFPHQNQHAMPEAENAAIAAMDSAERHRNEKTLSSPDAIIRLPSRSAFYKMFELGSQIGQGNFSDVFLVYSAERGEKYAVKEIDKSRMRGKLHFVENEIALLLRSPHKHICRLVEAFECARNYFIVFEYAQKGDLFETIKRVGHLGERNSAQITRQIASALAFLHRRRIVHRDVKPENILLSADSTVKLTDFGLACVVLGPLYRVCGTPTYVAPEILNQQGYGIEVDVWSLGIILHICLAGFAPFRCTERVELFKQIVRARITFEHSNWARVSFKAKRLLLGMLVPSPEGRMNAEAVGKHDWIMELGNAKETV